MVQIWLGKPTPSLNMLGLPYDDIDPNSTFKSQGEDQCTAERRSRAPPVFLMEVVGGNLGFPLAKLCRRKSSLGKLPG